MASKTLALPLQIALQAVVIETRLSDRDNSRMRRQALQFVFGDVFFGTMIRMNSDGGEKISIVFSEIQHLRKIG